jgi:uncharacterized membrane protein
MDKTQNRFKSVVTWASIIALILNCLVQFGVLLPEQSNAISGAISGILNALVIFGILNNPTNPIEF